MNTINLNKIPLNEFTAKQDSRQHCKATFPLLGANGSKKIAAVYFEIAPGDNLGRHTDNAEELLVILEGRLEVTAGSEKSEVQKGQIALIPELVAHDLKNIGTQTAKVLGVFGGVNNVVATFEKEWLPEGSNVIDTAALF